MKILSLREHPEQLERFIEYFTRHWHADAVYRDCMSCCLGSSSSLPQWYCLVGEDNSIIGGAGLIPNDFNSRMDLWPWLCALYVEQEHRGHAYASQLMGHLESEAARLGFPKLYLCTEHTGYYERYGWRFIGEAADPFGDRPRIYETTTPLDLRLESERLIFRELTQDDACFAAKMLQDKRVMYAWEYTFPEQEIRRWIDKNRNRYRDYGYGYCVAIDRRSHESVGMIGLIPEEIGGFTHTGVAWMLCFDQWHKGYAYEGAKAWINYGFQNLNLPELIADIRPMNSASCHLAERLGMKATGSYDKIVNGKIMEHRIYRLRMSEV